MKYLKSCWLIILICSCQKEIESDKLTISATGECEFTASFQRADGYQHDIGFDCEQAKFITVNMPAGNYKVLVHNYHGDTLHMNFLKTSYWQQLEIDW
jgi:hypothetical protein